MFELILCCCRCNCSSVVAVEELSIAAVDRLGNRRLWRARRAMRNATACWRYRGEAWCSDHASAALPSFWNGRACQCACGLFPAGHTVDVSSRIARMTIHPRGDMGGKTRNGAAPVFFRQDAPTRRRVLYIPCIVSSAGARTHIPVPTAHSGYRRGTAQPFLCILGRGGRRLLTLCSSLLR